MKKNTKQLSIVLAMATCLTAGACGKTGTPSDTQMASDASTEAQTSQNTGTEQTNSETNVIAEQTFDVTLEPQGEVTFVSYEPDLSKSPLSDATFVLKQNNSILYTLPGVYEDNIRANETFNSVEAVSFPDYNFDGYSDIIIICNYSPSSGPDVGTGYSEVRLYPGNADGTFMLDADLSQETNSALAEITVKNVLSFLGSSAASGSAEDTAWRQAYIDFLKEQPDKDNFDGYVFLFLDDDDIPEIAEIGKCEAIGCKILNYADDQVNETQLSRLNFTYVPSHGLLCNSDGNMWYYYDIVYSLVDGRLTQIGEGIYEEANLDDLTYDEEGFAIIKYDYYWDGEQVSQTQYENSLNWVYDTDQAVPGYTWGEWYSLDDMLLELTNHSA